MNTRCQNVRGAVVIDLAAAIAALNAYRSNLTKRGKLLQARAVGRCIVLLKRVG